MLFTPNYDTFGLVSYHTSATLEQPLTKDFNDPEDITFVDDTVSGCVDCSLFAVQVLELTPGSSTNIGHGINLGKNELLYGSGRQDAAKIRNLMTDGIASKCGTGSSCSTSAAESYAYNEALAAANNGITIYTIGLSASVNDSLLQSIADVGGGIYLNAPTSDHLEMTSREVADAIRILQ